MARFRIGLVGGCTVCFLAVTAQAAPAKVANIITLVCTVNKVHEDKPAGTETRVFTVNYKSAQIYVVQGERHGRILIAKNITDAAIDFPDYTAQDYFQRATDVVQMRGVERIDRVTGAYKLERTTYYGPLGSSRDVDSGDCKPTDLVPFPTAKF